MTMGCDNFYGIKSLSQSVVERQSAGFDFFVTAKRSIAIQDSLVRPIDGKNVIEFASEDRMTKTDLCSVLTRESLLPFRH